jgi:hypothetical protein
MKIDPLKMSSLSFANSFLSYFSQFGQLTLINAEIVLALIFIRVLRQPGLKTTGLSSGYDLKRGGS